MNKSDSKEKKTKPGYSIVIGMVFIILCGIMVYNRYRFIQSHSTGYIGLIITILIVAVLINLIIKGVVPKNKTKNEESAND